MNPDIIIECEWCKENGKSIEAPYTLSCPCHNCSNRHHHLCNECRKEWIKTVITDCHELIEEVVDELCQSEEFKLGKKI